MRLTVPAAVGWSALLAVVSCLSGLGWQPLSWDEAVTASAATRSVPALARLLAQTDAPLGFYYAGMHGWLRVLHTVGVQPSESWLRLPSALAAIAVVAGTAALAGRWLGAQSGLIAGALLAVQPMFVFYAHDARPYTLATLLVVVATALLIRALRQPALPWLAAYGAACVGALYLHLFAALALLPHATVIARRPAGRWRFALVGLAVAAAVAPLAWRGSRQTGEIGWIPHPTIGAVGSFALKFGGGAMLVPLVALLLLAAWRRRPEGSIRSCRMMLAGWAVLPPAGLIVADFAQPVLVARYALVGVPAVAILAAYAARRVGGRLAAGLVVAALLAGVVTSVVQQAQPFKYEDYRGAADAVADTAKPGDGVLFLPASTRVGYDRYLSADTDDPGSARAVDMALLAGAGPQVAGRIGGLEVDPVVLARDIAGYRRIYLVGDGLGQSKRRAAAADLAKAATLRADYTAAWTRGFGQVNVTLFVWRASGAIN
jgi:mannosyltransferase